MSILVFVSSTRHDLDKDCRRGALEGIKCAAAVPVEMDDFDTDYIEASYENVVTLCCDMVARSSHYLGVFAYRRGWGPPPPGKSITEVEFDYALACKRTMAVFVPKPNTPFSLTLKQRAKRQSIADAQAQDSFVKGIDRRILQTFDNAYQLPAKVHRTVCRWLGRSVLAEAQAAVGAPRPLSRPRPTEDEIGALGRRQHLRQFEDTLEGLVGQAPPRVACFLVHGPGGHGHDVLTMQLARTLDRTAASPPRHVIVKLDVPWRGKGVAALLAVVARELGLDSPPASVAALAAELETLLETTDVVLEIRRAQYFDGSLPYLTQAFWQPLTAALRRPVSHRLIGMITLEEDVAADWDALLQQPPASAEQGSGGFDPGRFVRLARLDPFAQKELALWLGRWFPNAAEVARDLLRETRDGHPLTLYTRLRDPALWTI